MNRKSTMRDPLLNNDDIEKGADNTPLATVINPLAPVDSADTPLVSVVGNHVVDNETSTPIPSLFARISEISSIFIPIYCVEMTKTGINFANMSIFSHIDENYAAAASFISSTVVLYSVAITALNFYLPNLLRKYEAQKNIIIFYAFIVNIALSLIVGLVSYFTSNVLRSLGTASDLTQLISEFYNVFPFAVPSIFQFLMWQQINAAQGRQRLLYISSAIAAVTSIFWTTTTVFWKQDLAPGTVSSKIAGSYVVGYTAGALFYIVNAYLNKHLNLPSRQEFKENLHLLSEWIRNGWPSVGHITNELLAVIMLPILVVAKMDCSDSDLALVNVVGGWNLSTVTFAIAAGIATNIVMCGYLHGNYYRAELAELNPSQIENQNILKFKKSHEEITVYWLNTANIIRELTLKKASINSEIITFLNENSSATSITDFNFLRNLYSQFDCSPYDNKYELAQAYGNSIFWVTSLFNTALLVASQLFPIAFVSAFANPNDVTANTTELRALFGVVFAGLLFNSYRDVLASILRALDIVNTPMYASVIALWAVGMVLSYTLGVTYDLKVLGLETGYCAGLEFGTLYLGLMWWTNSKPEVARENHHDKTKLAAADSFTGQLSAARKAVAAFFQDPRASVASCLPCLKK